VVIRSGVVLPTFRDTPDDALAAAESAVTAGIDGLFCYDHLWPMGQPERPALAPFPLLGALAARFGPRTDGSGGPYFGTLVARIGLVPHAVLAAEFRALARLAPGRVIAGLGTGDSLSAEENRAYGIPFAPAAERRAEVVALARELTREGIAVWVAGGPAGRVDEAQAAGTALNVWDADPMLVTQRSTGADPLEVTWAGPPPQSVPTMVDTVTLMAGAGATWVLFGWPVDVDAFAEAARAAALGPSSEAVSRQP
jgi:alkanesulfonate monooxygenase SsuD/methylene tetrahydromethanopterin reductase-like flavin-dependent oxidoreductase (luciferase family)